MNGNHFEHKAMYHVKVKKVKRDKKQKLNNHFILRIQLNLCVNFMNLLFLLLVMRV